MSAKKDWRIDWEQLKSVDYETLYKKAKQYAAAVNRRINNFLPYYREQSPAYKRLESYEGAPYIRKSLKTKSHQKGAKNVVQIKVTKDMLIEELRSALSVASVYLQAKSGTERGLKEINENKRKALIKKMPEFKGNVGDQEEFLRFLGSPEIRELMKNFDSNIVVRALRLGKRAAGEGSLQEIFQRWKDSEMSLAEWIVESEDIIRNRGETF